MEFKDISFSHPTDVTCALRFLDVTRDAQDCTIKHNLLSIKSMRAMKEFYSKILAMKEVRFGKAALP